MTRIAIVGSRDFKPLQLVRDLVQRLPGAPTIVSGGAQGVDTTAELTALHRGLHTKVWSPNWKKHGGAAGMLRNQQIINDSDFTIAFWNGTSRGTKDSIDKTRAAGKDVYIIKDYTDLLFLGETIYARLR